MAVATEPVETTAQSVFSSTQSANLPTTETLRPGDWLFEISHRFQPAVSEGFDALFGLDGGVFNRIGLAYSPVEGALFAIQRTNRNDNLELNLKLRLADSEADARGTPQAVAVLFGAAWDAAMDTERLSYYGQLVWNGRVNDVLALGVVPSYVWRRSYESVPAQPQDGQLALGVNAALELTPSMRLIGEWITSNEPSEQASDSHTLGVELETRGHFFKIVLTNQIWMNPTQHLMGSSIPFEPGELRLGFNIQRLLPL